MSKVVVKKKQSVLAEAVQKLQDISEVLDETKEALFVIAVELDKFNEQLGEFFKEVKDKGVKMRAV